MSAYKIKCFSLAEFNNGFVGLLNSASNHLSKIWPITIQDIVILNETDNLHEPNLPVMAVYYIEDDESLRLAKFAKKGALVERVSNALPMREIIDGPISILTLRLQQGNDQDNISKLLKFVAQEIASIPDENILEIIYKNFTDNDAISHPFVVVYYRTLT